MGGLYTFHNTMLCYDPSLNQSFHGRSPFHKLEITLDGDRIALMSDGKYLHIIGSEGDPLGQENYIALNQEIYYPVIHAADGTINIKVGDRFLSARKDGLFSLVRKPNNWEKFYLSAKTPTEASKPAQAKGNDAALAFSDFDKRMRTLEKKIDNQAMYANRLNRLFYNNQPKEFLPIVLKHWYFQKTGRPLNLEDPKTYNEKVQYFKLHGVNRLVTNLSDKIKVREYVRRKGLGDTLLAHHGVYSSPYEIDFDALPEKFVIKCNHGCAMNLIVTDKKKINRDQMDRTLNTWLSTNFAYSNGLELQYRDITPRIFIEEYIENFANELYDYKFWCFNGKVKYIQFLSERKQGLKMAFYTPDWIKQDFVYNYQLDEKELPAPENLDKMIKIAESLAQGFPHVRIDLYSLDKDHIYFGEFTFSSLSGICKWSDESINNQFGEYFDVSQYHSLKYKLQSLLNSNF